MLTFSHNMHLCALCIRLCWEPWLHAAARKGPKTHHVCRWSGANLTPCSLCPVSLLPQCIKRGLVKLFTFFVSPFHLSLHRFECELQKCVCHIEPSLNLLCANVVKCVRFVLCWWVDLSGGGIMMDSGNHISVSAWAFCILAILNGNQRMLAFVYLETATNELVAAPWIIPI